MLKKIYIGAGSVLIVGYLAWSVLGFELFTPRMDNVPSARRSTGRSSVGYFGRGYGFGK